LIEVKGKAEKVALAPDDFPRNTLVTGTCFKLTTHDRIDQYMLVAYLTCRYGQILKDRLKSNLLVSYLAKDDLYGLPVPSFSNGLKTQLQSAFVACFECNKAANVLLKEAEATLLRALNLENWQAPEPLSYIRDSREAFAAGRFDAEYFHPAKTQALSVLWMLSDKTIGDFFHSARDLWQPENGTPVETVRNYDLTDALSPILDPDKATIERSEIASTKKILRKGDIVVSRLRSYLKEIALVLPNDNTPIVASTEFIVLRPVSSVLAIDTLLIYLRSQFPQVIFKWSQDGSNHPRFNEKELLGLPVPRILLEDQKPYVEAVQTMREAKQRATSLLESAKRAVEIAIEDSETAALDFLRDAEE
jgi:hypothetical protein